MNPYTGGYDLCLEASEDVLSAFVAAAVGGQELFIPVQFAGVTGLVHLLIERAELAIDPSREASALVTVTFRDSSVQLALPGSTGPLGPLGGELIVGVPFSLGPVTNDPDLGDVRGIQVDLSLPAIPGDLDPVTVDVAPDPASRLLLDQLLAPAGLGFAAAAPLISAAVRAEVALQFGAVPLGNLAIPVTVGGDGTLGVSLSGPPEQARFGSLDLASVGLDEDGRPGVLAVLAAVNAGADGLDRQAKTRTVTRQVSGLDWRCRLGHFAATCSARCLQKRWTAPGFHCRRLAGLPRTVCCGWLGTASQRARSCSSSGPALKVQGGTRAPASRRH
jgi:hypothetical protein